MSTVRNTLLTLSFTALTITNLDAMKDKNNNQYTLVCGDDTRIAVSYQALAQLPPLKNMVDDFDQEDALVEIPVDQAINSGMMRIMVKYMNLVSVAQAKGCSKRDIILNLGSLMKAKTLKYYTVETLKNYLEVADFLDFKIFSQALYLLIAQEIHARRTIECIKPYGRLSPEITSNIKKAYYLSSHKHVDDSDPVIITLQAMDDYGLIDAPFETFASNLNSYITYLLTNNQFDVLQATLDTLCHHAIPLAMQANKILVAYVKALPQAQMEQLFAIMIDESTLKMALRLFYAKAHNLNLDELDCVKFVKNINTWVGDGELDWTEEHTSVLAQDHLRYALPLLESLIGTRATSLHLFHQELTSIPAEIGLLANLKTLELSGNLLTKLTEQIGTIRTLQVLHLGANELTELPTWLPNLVNLELITLFDNPLPQNTKQVLEQQCGNRPNLAIEI